MPRIQREKLPRQLLYHLLELIRQREISTSQMPLFGRWGDGYPVVPSGKWFKCFPEMTVCGEGELVKTFLRAGQLPDGEEVE